MRPWNEIGTNVSEYEDDFVAAMEKANVMFNVSVRQGFFIPNDALMPLASSDFRKAESYFYIVRDDIPAALGTCRGVFTPLQNTEAIKFFEPFFRDNICVLDTIGTFGLGQKVWFLAKLTGSTYQVVPGDDIELYLILVNSHDESTKVMVGIVPIRIWCANMFSMLNKSEFQIIKFKHTGDPAEKLRHVQTLINDQLSTVEGFVNKLKELTKKWPSPEELNTYFRDVFKVPEGSSTRAENKIKQLKELFIHGRGNQGEAVRGTWYAAYNAASEYLNYFAGNSQETRLNSLWFGVNNNTNHLALQEALKRCTIADV